MKTIPIPVKNVYFQLINNNVLDLKRFGLETATANEQSIYNIFVPKQESVIGQIQSELTNGGGAYSALSKEFQDYYDNIYSDLTKSAILNKKLINYEDETYVNWTNGNISFRDFLLYAISQNWIDTSKIINSSETKYSDSDEIYNSLVAYVIDKISHDTEFSKKIYYYLIYNGSISGNSLCMALYDQGILPPDENAYRMLSAGGSAYDFIREQIRLIKITPAQLALDPCSASLVVTDVNSGDVLALITYPSYDNNMLSGTIDAVYWNKLNSIRDSLQRYRQPQNVGDIPEIMVQSMFHRHWHFHVTISSMRQDMS